MEQYYSASARETLMVFSDTDPGIELEYAWKQAHPDLVLLMLSTEIAAIGSRTELIDLCVERWSARR